VPLKRNGRNMVGLCPFHNEKTPSFNVYSDHYHCFGCGAHGDVFTWLTRTRRMSFPEAVRYLGSGASYRRPVASLEPHPLATAGGKPRNLDCARRIWMEATDPRATPIETYLHSRGVRLPDEPVIRWHPRCPRGADRFPTMVALMVDPITGQPSGIHRTFLVPDGSNKATVEEPKMMLGNAGVIRLAEPVGEGLGLAEGVETSLSVMQIIGWGPVWAAGSRTGIAAFPVLSGHSLTIFADSDEPGLTAARACAARWDASDQEALIWVPPDGYDWNDCAVETTA
jgi:putative DNA primase/helicase